jgi:type IV fimbrial biogenesis protein FimT
MRGLFGELGHTLAEVLVSMSILSGLMAVAVPELVEMVTSARLRASMSALADGLRLTRFEAMKTNSRIVMCKSFDGLQCSLLGDWSQGWIVFQDRNNSGRLDLGETIVYREMPMKSTFRMKGNTLIKDYVSYTQLGKAEMLSGRFQNGTFTVCAESATKSDAYEVIINNMGRPRVQKVLLDNCN